MDLFLEKNRYKTGLGIDDKGYSIVIHGVAYLIEICANHVFM